MLCVVSRDVGHCQQFFAASSIAALSQFFSERRITQNMALGRFEQNERRCIERVLRITSAAFTHFRHQRAQPVIKQARIINNDMPLPFIRLVDAKNLRPYGGLHLLRHLAVDEILHRPVFPIGIQHLTVGLLILIADFKAILRTGGELVQFLKQPVGIHLR